MTSPTRIFPRYLSADGLAWKRYERADRIPPNVGGTPPPPPPPPPGSPFPPGPWVPGVTQPLLDNEFTSMATCGPRVDMGTLNAHVITTTVHASGTTQYNQIYFKGTIILDSGAPTFVDCRIGGTYTGKISGASTGLVDNRASGVTGALFDFCHFEPEVPSAAFDAGIGHHATFRRCVMTLTVDGVGVYNKFGSQANVHIEGCWIGFNSWWYPDPTGIQSNGMHCDGVQIQAASNTWVQGNTIFGYITDMTGNANPNNPSGSNNGPHPWLQTGQLVMVQWNAGGGTKTSNVTITDNFCYGGANGLTVRDLLDGITIKRNHWMDNGQKRDGSHANYVRCSSGQVINGISYVTGFHTVTGTDAPAYWGFDGFDTFGVHHNLGDPIIGGVRVP